MLSRNFEEDFNLVKEFIITVIPLFEPSPSMAAYNHMGALLTDVSLQAGLNYETVVQPRVERVLRFYSEVDTTYKLKNLLKKVEISSFLNWQHKEKLNRFTELLNLFLEERLDSIDELCDWASIPESRSKLMSIKGVGEKTVDYMRILCGHETYAIDRHLIRVIELAGVKTRNYKYSRCLLESVSSDLNISARSLDGSLWRLMRSI